VLWAAGSTSFFPTGAPNRHFFRLTGSARTSFQGEVAAILLACNLINDLELPASLPVYIISDCQAAIKAIVNPKCADKLSCEAFEAFQATPQVVNIVWIPSHLGIAGNDSADELAKQGAEQSLHTFEVDPSLAGWKARIKAAAFETWGA